MRALRPPFNSVALSLSLNRGASPSVLEEEIMPVSIRRLTLAGCASLCLMLTLACTALANLPDNRT